MSELSYPEDLRYTSDHEWVAVASDGTARVGITSFAQNALGDVVYVSLPAVGATVSAGDACGEVESTKSVSDVYSPLTESSRRSTSRSTRRPNWSTATLMATAGCSKCVRATRRRSHTCWTPRHTRQCWDSPRICRDRNVAGV